MNNPKSYIMVNGVADTHQKIEISTWWANQAPEVGVIYTEFPADNYNVYARMMVIDTTTPTESAKLYQTWLRMDPNNTVVAVLTPFLPDTGYPWDVEPFRSLHEANQALLKIVQKQIEGRRGTYGPTTGHPLTDAIRQGMLYFPGQTPELPKAKDPDEVEDDGSKDSK